MIKYPLLNNLVEFACIIHLMKYHQIYGFSFFLKEEDQIETKTIEL